VRPRDGAPCYGIEKDFPHALKDFQYIGIDPNEPWEAVYTCQVEADTGVGGSPLALQSGWTTGFDESSGATFYYNERTGQSQWHPP
jgi:hypothetical protein